MYTLIAETYGEPLELALRTLKKYEDRISKKIFMDKDFYEVPLEDAVDDDEHMYRFFLYFDCETEEETLELAEELSERMGEDFSAIDLSTLDTSLYTLDKDGIMDEGRNPFEWQGGGERGCR